MGADRALKRLALLRVRDVDLWKAPRVRPGDPVAHAQEQVADSDLPYSLLIDADGKPLGWLSERDLAGERVPAEADTAPDAAAWTRTRCSATPSPSCSRRTRSTGRSWTNAAP